jgi:DNA-binding transcriptional MerR regulator
MKELTKLYYSISEVSALTELPASVLRYWETEFSALRPPKNRAGKRTYRASDIERVQLIKKLLYADRFTIEGAKKYLKGEIPDSDLPPPVANESTAPAVPAADLRRGLKEILEILES